MSSYDLLWHLQNEMYLNQHPYPYVEWQTPNGLVFGIYHLSIDKQKELVALWAEVEPGNLICLNTTSDSIIERNQLLTIGLAMAKIPNAVQIN